MDQTIQGLVGLAIVAGAGVVWWIRHRVSPAERRRRKLRDRPPVRIADVKPGDVVKVVGRVVPIGGPVLAPLTGTQCVYYEVVVDRQPRRSIVSRQIVVPWINIIREWKGIPFELDDGSGKIRIDPMPAICQLAVRHAAESSASSPPTPVQVRLLEAHGKKDDMKPVRENTRFHESRIVPGDQVAVIGRAEQVDGQLCLVAGSGSPELLLSDRPEVVGTPGSTTAAPPA